MQDISLKIRRDIGALYRSFGVWFHRGEIDLL
jgi:hypothetical protein